MRIAALDLGSNTSLLLIAEVEEDQIKKVLWDETTITKMGQGVHATRKFHPEALHRVDQCLRVYRQKISELKCEKIVAVATSAARDVSNREALIEIGRAHGIPIQIISGADEAQLTYRGALCDRESTVTTEGVAVIDVGGGSTEIIMSLGGVPFGTSVDVGSVRLTELFVHSDPINKEELAQVNQYAQHAFAKAPLPAGRLSEVVAVAGTPTTLAALDQRIPFQEERIQGYKMSLKRIDEWTERLAQMPLDQRAALPGMQPKRADVIVSGATILASALRALRMSEITVSTRGVRYGAALEWQKF